MPSKRERVIRTIRREEIDYLPSQITFADRTRDHAIHEALGLPAHVTLDEHINNHMVIALSKQDYPLFYRNDLKLMRELEAEGYVKVDEENRVVYDSWGMGIRIGSDGFFACFHPLERQQSEAFAERWMPARIHEAVVAPTLAERVHKYAPPDPHQSGTYDWMQKALAEHGDEYFVYPSGYFGIFERAYGLVSIPLLLESMVADPDVAAELFDKILHYKLLAGRQMLTMNFDAMHCGDDLGTQLGPLFSPRLFRQLLKPCYKRLWGEWKEAGKFVMMHSCGCVRDYLPDLVEIGLDVIEPIQPCNDLELVKRRHGDRLTFWGGIDTQRLLPFGTPDDVRREAARVIRTLGRGGGHIIGPAQEVMKDVPLENIVALLETIVAERGRTLGDAP
ncbi:MAG: uroporphyrinogen decarboxylase family protein [Thermoguttaceae bacterium]|jgi:uroporphyrinogen decarboxylase